MRAALHFEVLDLFVGVAAFPEEVNEVEGVVNGVNDAIVVAIIGFVEGAGLEPEALVIGPRFGRFEQDIVHDAVGIGIGWIYVRPAPPQRAGENARGAKHLRMPPYDIQCG